MWDEVSLTICPTQKVNLDVYLNAYYLCVKTGSEIANQIGVSKVAVIKALKNYDKVAYSMERSRRKEENACKRRQKDMERKQTAEARQRDRERKRREREESNTYIHAVRKELRDKEIVSLLRRAAREIGLFWDQWVCALYIPEATTIQHPCPGQAKEKADMVTPSEAVGRAEYEFHMLKSGMSGVPGPAVLKIRQALELGDTAQAFQLAREAINMAGYVNPYASVKAIMAGLSRNYSPGEISELRSKFIEYARAMAKVPDPPALADLPREEKEKLVGRWQAQYQASIRDWRGRLYDKGGTGKRGKEGGLRSSDRGEKMSARTRS